jgi:methylenetetrahydrofolate dehydrogenase (NADP+)/methenyltetrahydrofolate cyclohydrolase
MQNKIIDCRNIAKEFLIKTKKVYKELLLNSDLEYLKLAIIQIGKDYASSIYIKNKIKYCNEFGIAVEVINLQDNIEETIIIEIIKKLNENLNIHGILLQLPIPKKLNVERVLNLIDANKDVDGFNKLNLGATFLGDNKLSPCTAKGILYIIKYLNLEILGSNIVVLGKSNIVGKPIALQLINLGATVTICNSKTKNIKQYTTNADILIVAIGKMKFIKSNMIKKDCIIIDVGINRDKDNKICGDVDLEDVIEKVKYITPVPYGIGKMTIAMLIANVLECYLKQINRY